MLDPGGPSTITATDDGGGGSGGGGGGDNTGPWIGHWVQVNFLADDDNGVWDEDDLSGIGFVAEISETEWIKTDDYGNGCSVTYSYSVDGQNKYIFPEGNKQK